MVFYSVIMFLVAVPFLWVSIAIYRGKTDLIHDYHRTKVTDQKAYGKAFGRAMFIITAALFSSGILGLLGDPEKTAWVALAVLFAGLASGIAAIVAVQKKFNNGIF